MQEIKNLVQLQIDQKAKVVDIRGGRGMIKKIDNLGIRLGSVVTKVSSQFWRGPITIKVNGSLIALGFGVASRIIVKIK
jgi:ferrous iron transport protein A